MSKEQCNNCKFYSRNEQEEMYFDKESGAPLLGASCRRYPPKQDANFLDSWDFERRVAAHYFPLVAFDEWCGEWKPAAEGEA